MMLKQLLCCVLMVACAASTASAASTGATVPGLAEVVVGVVRGCSAAADASECVRGRALDAVGHSLSATLDKWRHADIKLFGDDVVLVANDDDDRAPRTLFKGESSASEIVEMIASFVHSRTLQMRIPKQIIPANLEEARGKLKKMGGTLLAGLLMMKGTLGALAMGALALIAGKALLLSVLSLALSLIAALKKQSSGHDHRRSGRRADEVDAADLVATATVASAADSKATAHYLAYRHQQPYHFAN